MLPCAVFVLTGKESQHPQRRSAFYGVRDVAENDIVYNTGIDHGVVRIYVCKSYVNIGTSNDGLGALFSDHWNMRKEFGSYLARRVTTVFWVVETNSLKKTSRNEIIACSLLVSFGIDSRICVKHSTPYKVTQLITST